MGEYLNLQHLDQEQALSLAKFYINSGQSMFLFGQKGTGKTAIGVQAIKECGYKVNYINLSVLERPDLLGMPLINSTSETVTYKSPSFLPKLLKGKPNEVIIFDEVDKCPYEITAPLLEILQFRTINGTKINAAACILTGNLQNERAHSNEISTALLDRGAKYILDFNFEKWIDWAKANNVHDLILGFLKNNQELACGKVEDSSYASPSPRGWTMASQSITKARELKIVDIETVTHIISGFVGNEAGLKFKLWYDYFRRFEPYIFTLIQLGEMQYDFNSLTPTEKLIFVISACYQAKTKTFSEKNFVYLENLCSFFTKYKIDKEMQVMGLYNSFSFDDVAKYELFNCKVFFDLFEKINKGVQIKK